MSTARHAKAPKLLCNVAHTVRDALLPSSCKVVAQLFRGTEHKRVRRKESQRKERKRKREKEKTQTEGGGRLKQRQTREKKL